MGFTDAVKTCLSKYATFSGRASRSEFWWFYLFFILASMVTGVIDALLLGHDPSQPGSVPWLSVILTLALILPSLAATIRRLHDKDRSGWWYLLIFIPLIGGIVILVWLVSRGTAGPNRFGPDPLGETNVESVF
ncbi:MAG: DUF805 domain-containing protein [Sphingomonas sp.]|nr:MAG: DUF805 domain-containing protein [Sphingomonas sp.]